MENVVTDGEVAVSPPKQRDALFDVAKGIGILLVLGHHSFSNSARLYSTSHSWLWWGLNLANRILSFSVPVFLLISAVLSARGLIKNPAVGPFYRKRFPAILWPYLVWTGIYWIARMVIDPKSRLIVPGSIFGIPVNGPAMFVHVKERLLDVFWGKAFFHMYFMVVLFEILLLLPLAVAYVKWRKPGFWEVLATAFALQGAVMVFQHYTAFMPFPGSNAFWYLGSLLPGAWIGANWELFKEQCKRYVWPLSVLILITGGLFLREEWHVIHHIEADNYLSNGSLTIYASCLAVLVLVLSMKITLKPGQGRLLESLGKNSLQIYLMHPAIMQMLERPRIVSLIKLTHLGPILSPAIMLAIVFGLIRLLRVTHTEKLLFGRG